ncbi:MAG: hypothetical protein IKN54_09385 [Lachnospiraceae bacterium]|nr:hypothetical protein [Lachnospiraceae bacterium]
MLTFNYAWQGDVKRTIRYLDRTIDFESGAFAVQEVGVEPIIMFQVSFNSTKDNLKDIENFYLIHRKSRRFIFVYDGEEYTCQFTSDWQSTDTWGFDENGRIIGAISVDLTMRVVQIDGNYTDPFVHIILDTDKKVLIDCGDSTSYESIDDFDMDEIDGGDAEQE